jgi:transposase
MSKSNKREKRSFTEQFKRDAVNLVVVEGHSFTAAARAVNLNPGSLRRWHAKYAPEPEACGETATVAELQSEVQRLRKQLRQAELEREILKKATAYFAKESQ